jgi:hypothetical protein
MAIKGCMRKRPHACAIVVACRAFDHLFIHPATKLVNTLGVVDPVRGKPRCSWRGGRQFRLIVHAVQSTGIQNTERTAPPAIAPASPRSAPATVPMPVNTVAGITPGCLDNARRHNRISSVHICGQTLDVILSILINALGFCDDLAKPV